MRKYPWIFWVWMNGSQVNIDEAIGYPASGLSKDKRYAVIVMDEETAIKFNEFNDGQLICPKIEGCIHKPIMSQDSHPCQDGEWKTCYYYNEIKLSAQQTYLSPDTRDQNVS